MARLVEAVATGRHPDATPAWQLLRYGGQRPGAQPGLCKNQEFCTKR
jgi:hypothetical protein